MMNTIYALMAKKQKLIQLVLLAAAIVFPLAVKNPYAIRLAILSGIFVILSLSLNLLTGFAGQISLGHIAFYGIGAYTAAILSKNFGVNFILCMLAAMVTAGLFGFLLGLPTLKLGGYYLAIVTLGFSEIVRLVEINWMELTNGPLGINGIPKPALFGLKLSSPSAYYFICLLLVVLTLVVIRNILNSRIGYALGTVRGDDNAAKFMGVNVFRYKILAFVISAAFAGLAGAFFAQYVTFIDPTSFASDQSTLILIMIIFGGIGSLPGSIIGAVVLTLVPELLRDLMEYRMLIYGVVLVFMMLVRPEGLLGKINFKHIRQQASVGRLGAAKLGKDGDAA
ncbi:branched-chain amino acid ABC transporter permease [Agathobaculum sp.]|uniref:branched-chain amino acid ABC transporter permease n=1 Tax=Agathobaculum sp. TaxID=2048138 RepID=UPI002A81BBE8|nr:branched-chain amino acid ABC transporter permease [Agathobaculum sp.]MDY3617883.1 branched-chain amino acid ABC transporter permease [Agathobaculum sp.]